MNKEQKFWMSDTGIRSLVKRSISNSLSLKEVLEKLEKVDYVIGNNHVYAKKVAGYYKEEEAIAAFLK